MLETIVLCTMLLSMQCTQGMDAKKPARDDDEGVRANKPVIQDQKVFLESQAIHHSDIFGRDNAKVKQAVRMLMAVPSVHLAYGDRMVDRLLENSLKKHDEVGVTSALKLRANPNCYDNQGESALLTALRCPWVDMRLRLVKTLLDHNALPNAAHQNSFTPLHYAVYSYQQAIKQNSPDKDLSLAIIKLLIERGARLRIAIFAELDATNKRATPLSFLETQDRDVINLVKYILTYVYPEDVFLRQFSKKQSREEQQNEIVSCVLKRNELLLSMTAWHARFHSGSAKNVCFLPLMNLVNPKRCEANFKQAILANVQRIMDAPQGL